MTLLIMKRDPWAQVYDEVYDDRHGGPYDRGSADAWYGRPFKPHYFTGDTYKSSPIPLSEDTAEYAAYKAGYESVPFGAKYMDE